MGRNAVAQDEPAGGRRNCLDVQAHSNRIAGPHWCSSPRRGVSLLPVCARRLEQTLRGAGISGESAGFHE